MVEHINRLKELNIEIVITDLQEKYKILVNNFPYKNGVSLSQSMQNIAMLDYFKAMVKRFGELILAVDYFNNIVDIIANNRKISISDKNRLFINIAIDSVRSSIDIFSKSIAHFFNLKVKNGFTYDGLIKPFKSIDLGIFNKLNELYSSDNFMSIKEIRDSEKHTGDTSAKYIISNNEIEVKKKFDNDYLEIEKDLCETIKLFLELIDCVTNEMYKFKPGYVSNTIFNEVII